MLSKFDILYSSRLENNIVKTLLSEEINFIEGKEQIIFINNENKMRKKT